MGLELALEVSFLCVCLAASVGAMGEGGLSRVSLSGREAQAFLESARENSDGWKVEQIGSMQKMRQTVDGVRVFGAEVTVKMRSGRAQTAIGKSFDPAAFAGLAPVTVTAEEAMDIARAHLAESGKDLSYSAELYLKASPVTKFYIVSAGGLLANYRVWVDAYSGEISSSYDNVQRGKS